MTLDFLTPVVRELGLGILIKATVVMAVAAFLTLKFKRSSAAVRYTIWGAAFTMLIILPIALHPVPEWIVIQRDAPAKIVPIQSDDGTTAASLEAVRTRTGGTSTVVKQTQPAPNKAGSHNPAATSADEQTAGGAGIVSREALPAAAFAIWLLVSAALLSRFIVQVLSVGGITRRAIRVKGGLLGGSARTLVADLGIRRHVRVMLSEEVSMPFAWGLFKPAIILPIDAGEWPQDRIRSVMTHELAHIARWDYVIHIAIEAVRALYWPNPIVWLAARKAVMERERACDDFTLRSGTRSVDYAEHLLHIAKTQIEANVQVAAVTMAGEPGLMERIDHVMNGKTNRSPMKKGVLMITTALIVLFVLPFATMAFRTNHWNIPDTKGLMRQLGRDNDPVERSLAAWWLGEHEDDRAVDALLDALNDDSRLVRIASAWALGEIKDRYSIDGLIETLETDREPLVREMAALALGEIEHPSAIGALERAYERDKSLAPAVIWALGEIAGRGSDEADDLRYDIIRDIGERPWDNDEVWTGSLKKQSLRSKNLEVLVEDLASKDDYDRRDAAFSIGYLGIKQRFETTSEVRAAVLALLATLEDPAPEVRAMAVWALDEINPSRKQGALGLLRRK